MEQRRERRTDVEGRGRRVANQENQNPNINRPGNLPFQGQFKNYNIYNQSSKSESQVSETTNEENNNVDKRDNSINTNNNNSRNMSNINRRESNNEPINTNQQISTDRDIRSPRNSSSTPAQAQIIYHRRPVFDRLVRREFENPLLMFNNVIAFGLPRAHSPFQGTIQRHRFDDDVFDPMFLSLGVTYNDMFRDNFSSNFRSNYGNPDHFFDLFELIRSSRETNPTAHPPTSQSTLESLKRFKMSEKYCKKNEKGETECPNCTICLADLNKDQEAVLIPCGHLFHSDCALQWLNQHNTCPVCRFELPSDN